MERRIRASALPRLALCPASLAESEGKVNASSPPALIGTAFHQAAELATLRGRDSVRVRDIAERLGADADEVQSLWDRFDFDFEGGQAEVKVEVYDAETDITIPGHIDWLREQPESKGIYHLVDWKTTWRIAEDPEPWNDPQTHAYAVGAFETLPDVKRVTLFKAYPRAGTESAWSAGFDVTIENVEEVKAGLVRIASRALDDAEKPQSERRFAVTHHCDWCPGRVTCPAVRAEYTRALNATSEVFPLTKKGVPSKRGKTVVDLEITYENAASVLELKKLMTKSASALGDELRNFIAQTGPIEVEPGKFIALKPRQSSPQRTDKNLLIAARNAGVEFEVMDRVLAAFRELPKTASETLDIYTEAQIASWEEGVDDDEDA